MKPTQKLLALILASTLLALATGCDRTVSKTEKTSVSSDGTVKSNETTVTQKSDGTMVKKQETQSTTPVRP